MSRQATSRRSRSDFNCTFTRSLSLRPPGYPFLLFLFSSLTYHARRSMHRQRLCSLVRPAVFYLFKHELTRHGRFLTWHQSRLFGPPHLPACASQTDLLDNALSLANWFDSRPSSQVGQINTSTVPRGISMVIRDRTSTAQAVV